MKEKAENMSIFYIGGFPPPFGGVTTKNRNLYVALSSRLEIKKIDFSEIKRKNIIEGIRFIKALIGRKNRFIVGVAGKNTRKRLCKLMYIINKKTLRESVIFLMGGTSADDIAADKRFQKYVSHFRCIYAETQSMCETLRKVGLSNVAYYPNCRFKPKSSLVKESCSENKNSKSDEFKLNAVFFSRVCLGKGIDIIVETARKTPDVAYHIYGEIEEGSDAIINEAVSNLKNFFYHGIFSGQEEEVISLLASYNVVLLPTRYKCEGVPGVLVESKIAGIPAIVSNVSYNSEIIQDGINGIVLQENNSKMLESAIVELFNSAYLKRLSSNAFISANDYYVESYLDSILKMLAIK